MTKTSCRRLVPALLACALLAALGCRTPAPTLEVVERVDVDRYLGRWYEIASYPQRFQEGCVGTTAEYSLREDGRIRVENTCRNLTLDGELRSVEGVAWVVDPEVSEAKLKVQFFWPFSGDYWIIELDPEYRWAVVGHPSREYLWILSRTPDLSAQTYQMLLQRVVGHGFDVKRLNRTPQAVDRSS